MNKKLVKAAFKRAYRSFFETLAATLPAGFVITPVMIEHADWNMIYVVLAWLGTAGLNGVAAFCAGLAGLPEVEGD